MISLSPGPAVRAAGPAVAAALPAGTSWRWPLRVAVLAATDVTARRFGRPAIAIVSITPGEGKQFPPAAQLAADAAGTLGWVAATAVLTAVLDRLPVPRPAAGLLLGSAPAPPPPPSDGPAPPLGPSRRRHLAARRRRSGHTRRRRDLTARRRRSGPRAAAAI